MLLKRFAFILTLGICSVKTEKKLPDFITACKRNKPRVSECYINSINTALPQIGHTGIPELNVGPIDPFVVEKISVDIGTGAILFHADLQDIKVWGLKEGKVLDALFDFEHHTFKIAVKTEAVYAETHYHATGKVLLFQFDSSGSANINFTNVHVNVTFHTEPFEKNGKIYGRGNITDIEFEMEATKVYIANLFPNEELNAAANEAFNANADVLYQEMKPLIIKSATEFLTNIMNKILMTYPADVLFPLE